MPSRSESSLPLPSIENGKWPLQNHHYDFVLQAFKACIGHVLELQSATQFSPDTAHPETDDELLEIAAEIAEFKDKRNNFIVEVEKYFSSLAMDGYSRAKKDLPPQTLPTLKQLEKSIHSVVTERHAGLTRTHKYLFLQRTTNPAERTQLKSSLHKIGRERFMTALILRNLPRFIELLATNHNWDHIQHDINAVKLDTTDTAVQKAVLVPRRILPKDKHRFDD